MLIVYKFNFELTIIGILLILRRGEEVHDVVFGKQGTAQNSHDLHDWTSKLEVVLNDSDETVCDDGTIQLAGNDLKRLAQAFVMQPSALSGATQPIAANTTAEPAEGKIVLGLLQPDGSINYSYTANAGFYVKADGSQGSWGDKDPLWFEYGKDEFIITYGHYPGQSEAGKSYTIKPVLVYTKNGQQYKATFNLNMQF